MAGALDGVQQVVLGHAVLLAGIGAVEEVLERCRVLANQQGIERHRLARAVLGLADLPGATRERAQVAVARGVDEDGGAPGFAA